MLPDHPFEETEKLIRCNVTNKYNEQTVRLVEFNHFKLWEYLMTHKHGARISHISLCLWISEEEYLDHEGIYSRAGDVEPVNRIIVDLFDEEYGFSNAITRFARESETEHVINILRSHVPKQLWGTNDCQLQTYKGYSVTQHKHMPSRPVMLGLEE
jgi:hypothetical protein